MKKNIFILIVVFLLGAAAVAETARETPPEGGKPKDFRLPAAFTIQLPNGLKAVLIPFGSLPKVNISLQVRAGNLNEAEEQVWLADLVGDLMPMGTTKRSAQALAEEAADMGGALSVGVSADRTTITGEALSEFAPDLIGLLADLVCHPAFPASEFERIRANRIRALVMSRANPNALVSEKFFQLLYPDHPYGRLYPTEANLRALTVEQVKAFYLANFGAARTCLYVAGRFDQAAVEKAVKAAFGGWAKGPDPLILIPKTLKNRQFALIDRPGAAQSMIALGLSVPDPTSPEYPALELTNTLLGGYFSSRITTNIREQKGYTYSPASQLTTRYRTANWAERASVGTDVTGPALKEIIFEIDRLGKETPSAEEVKAAQSYLIGNFVLANSIPTGIIQQFSFLDLHGLKGDYLNNYVKSIFALTPTDVQRVAGSMLKSDAMSLVVVGDGAKIKEQLTPYVP